MAFLGLFGPRRVAPGTSYEIRPPQNAGQETELWRRVPGKQPEKIYASMNASEVGWYRDEYAAGRHPGQEPDTYQWKVDHGIDPTEG